VNPKGNTDLMVDFQVKEFKITRYQEHEIVHFAEPRMMS